MKANLRNSDAEQAAGEIPVQPGSVNRGLILVTLLLLSFGLIMLMSVAGKPQGGETQQYYYVTHQLRFAGVGLVCMLCAMYVPHSALDHAHYPMLGFSIACLVLCPFVGIEINGAKRWLSLGFFNFQPFEVTKIAVAMYIGYFAGTKNIEQLRTFSTGYFPPMLFAALICGLLFLQPNFSGVILIGVLYFAMMFVSNARFLHSIIIACICASPLVLYGLGHGYRANRFTAWFDPFAYAQGSGYQTVQSYYALGNGGLTGMGFGEGTQKLRYLPEAHNDYIMAVLGEELGLIGITAVMALFLFFFYECYRIYRMQQTERDRITVFGLTMVIALNASLNLAVVFGVCPATGVCMPFFSYGGSNLVCSLITVGLLLNYSRKRGA